jgi:beta-barrel assembly-enhancing protease
MTTVDRPLARLKGIIPRILTTAAAVLAASLTAVSGTTAARGEQIALPDMGDSAGAVMSAADERQLANAFMREVRRSLHVVEDPEVNAYLHSLAEKLSAHLEGTETHFSFFAVSDPAINAFAGPGGYIGVNSGLVLATRSESELAAVLSHEMGHVIQRHIARTVEEARRMTLPAAAAMLAAILVGIMSPEVGSAALAATAAGQMQHEISFTREHEEEADRVGMQILARSGFDPEGMPDFFERMLQSERLATRPPAFLLDHPVTESRIAESRARAAQYPQRRVPDNLDYEIVKARLRVIEEADPRTARVYFQKSLDTGTPMEQTAARYGYALALFRTGAYDEALKRINRLLSDDPERRAYIILKARVQVASGQVSQGLQTFTAALRSNPGDGALTLAYSRSLLDADQPESARRILSGYVEDEPAADPDVYQLLAQAQGQTGRTVDAHESLSEFYYRTGDLRSAVDQLKMARRLARSDFYQASKIEARLSDLRAEAKAAKIDLRRNEDGPR